MSLCDTCMDPGRCCRWMSLSGGPPDPRTGKRIGEPMSLEDAEHMAMRFGLPFMPGEQDETGRWRYTCTALGDDGRCQVYETRPKLCRDYAAGSDGLCVHYWAPERGDRPLAETEELLGRVDKVPEE